MWQIDTSKIPEALGIMAVSLVVQILINIYLSRKHRTDEEACLLALRLNTLGTFVGFISVGSAAGISFSGAAPLVVTFSLGSPIAINLLLYSHSIQSNLIKKNIAQKKQKVKKANRNSSKKSSRLVETATKR